MTIEATRAGIQTRLDTIDGLNVYAYVPDNPTTPAVYPYPASIQYDLTMGDGAVWQTWTVEAMVSMASGKAAQLQLDELIEPDGPRSIKAALELPDGPAGQATLGGAVSDLRVISCTGYTPYVLATSRNVGGGSEALGCQWTVEVLV